jgi:hypothetical protein
MFIATSPVPSEANSDRFVAELRRKVGFFLCTMTADILKRPAIHEEVSVLGWEVGRERGRLHANTAIVGLNGDPYALCAQTCYAVPSDWAT